MPPCVPPVATLLVSGTVSARNNVCSVRSGLGTFFCSGAGTCDSPYRKLVCGPWGKVGSSKERVRSSVRFRPEQISAVTDPVPEQRRSVRTISSVFCFVNIVVLVCCCSSVTV